MALSDRDIIITPNRGASSEPIITLRGADAASSATMVMRVINSGTVSTLSFEGTAGQLFAVSDTFAGTIFSVNDVSGIPSLEVLDSGEIKLAEYNGFVNIKGTTNATSVNSGVLRVAGGVGIAQDVYIGGTLNVTGTLNAAVIAGSITNAANVAVTNDPSNGATMYPTFVSATSGNQTIRTDSDGLVWIPSSNRLGIGTTAPVSRLHVAGPGNVTGGNIHMGDNTNGAEKWSYLTGSHYNGATNVTGVSMIGLQSGASFNRVVIGGSIYESNPATEIQFWTHTATTHNLGGSQRMVIDTNGKVGIGSTAPLTKLHVEETGADIIGGNAVRASTMKGITLNNTNNDNSSVGVWFGTGPGSHWSGISGQRTNSAANWGTDLRFYTHEDATNDLTFSRERMRISSAGNVGIGTNAPTAKLEINPSDGGDTRSIQTFFNTSAVYNPAAAGTANRVVTGLRFNWYSENWQIGAGRGGGTDIQELSFSRNGTAHIIINSSGFLGIGKTVPTTRLHVFRDGLANNTVNPLITLDGKFNVTGVDSNDIVAIASRVENNGGGSQTTNIIGSGYQPSYNTLLLQPNGGNVGVNNINPGRALDVTGVTNVSSHITQGALISRPNVSWGASGTSTGAIVIRFPGGSGNYGMVHIVIDIYTYDGENASTLIIGGHNWNGQWYNFGATRVGTYSKGVRVAFKDGQYAVVLGTNTSTWSYGQVVVRKIQNGSYYSGVMDLGGTYTIAQDAAAESYSYISSNLITTGSAGGGGWNSGNDGSGSGLDADLLDGLDSTAFLRRDVSNSMFAGQGSQLSFENQGTFFRFAFNELRFYDWNNGIDIFGLNEHAYATTSMRAPIFYDRDNTAYYLDPAATGKAMLVNGNIELTARSESWAEGIRINVPTAGTWGGIRINRSGASGPGNWAIGYTGLNSTNDLTFYSGTTNTIQVNLDHSANLSSIGSMRAPIFYDSANTAYYLDPNADLSLRVYGEISNSNYVPGNLQPGALNIGRTDLNYNWAGGWSNDVRTGILANCLNNWEFAIHDSGERVVSPFAFFGGTGGQYLEMGRDIGWGTMPIIATNSFRAPIFYDQNNTAFYTDPASTSVVNNLTVNGTLTYTGSIAAGVDFARRLDNHTRTAFTVGGNASTFYPVVFQLGSGATAQQYGEFMIERGGYDDPGFTGVNFSTMNARFSHKASGWGFGSTYENCEALYQNVQLIANWQQVSESSRMIIWLRGATIYHFYNIVGNTTLVNANAAGGNIVESNPAFYTYTFTPTTTVNAKAQHSKYFNGGAMFDGNSRIRSLGIGTNASGTEGRLDVTADIRAPIYYDSNNTAFYTDPASTSVLSTMRVQGATSGYSLMVGENNTTGVFNDNARYGVVINAPYYPHLYLTATTDIGNTTHGAVISMQGRLSAGGFRKWNIGIPNRNPNELSFGWADNDSNPHYGVGINWGGAASMWIDTGHNLFARGSMRAPIFYDYNDTAYYVDPNSSSFIYYLSTNVGQEAPGGANSSSVGMVLRGNYNSNTWAHKFHKFDNGGGVPLYVSYTAGTGAWTASQGWGPGLSYTSQVFGSFAATSSVYSPIYYDINNTAFYADPASTSVFNNLTVSGTLTANVSPTSGFTLPCNIATGRSAYGRANANLVLLADSTYGAACIDFRSGVNYPSDGAQIYYETATNGVSGETSRLVIRTENDADDSILLRGGYIQYQSITVDGGSSNPGHRFTYGGTDRMYIYSDNTTETGSFRAPIFYDSNDTGFYTDPTSTSRIRAIRVASAIQSSSYGEAAIEVREFNYGGVQGDIFANYPRIGFHWGGRVASSIAMSSNGWINIMNNPGTGWENIRANQGLFNSEVTAYFSDVRLKTKVGTIDNAVEKIKSIETFKYVNNELANSVGFTDKLVHVGVSAQSVEAVFPEVVRHAPFDIKVEDGKEVSESGEWYKTVQYDKLVPLLIEAIKEQQSTIDQLRADMQELKELVKKSLGK